MSLAIVGDVEPTRAVDAVSAAFGTWATAHGPAVEFPQVVEPAGRRTRVLPMMNKSQADIAYGFTAITRDDPAFYAYWLMNHIMGQYSMGGRLGDSIRERQGMAYYVYSSLDANVAPGPLMVRAGVSPANVARTVASIDAELTSLVTDGPTENELVESKQYLDRLAAADARDQRRDRRIPPDGGVLRTRAGLRCSSARSAAGRHARRGARGGAARRQPIEGHGRRSRALRWTAFVNAPRITAVFFDVDFTLIYPGPTFQGVGYAQFCAKHGIRVDPSRFDAAVRAASSILDDAQEHVYDAEIFVRYTGRIIQEMGGTGAAVADCAREIYDEWAENQHFFLYDDVPSVLRELASRGLKIGLISNSHRPLVSFQQHFELEGLITAAVSSSEHGYMKPHPSIFTAALTLAGVKASESLWLETV